jgi:hypothetical protein|nr:MAG TPA: hypothetical protein [Caudoviricetes sp.]
MGEPAIDYNALIESINKGYLDWDYVYKADWAQAKETQEALDYLKNNTVQLETTSGAQRAWVKNMQNILNEADNIGDVANSNTVEATVSGTVSGVTNFAKDNAGKITSTTGVVSASTGLAAAGNFVFGTVIPAVCAVSAGCALGKTIDSVLYNANPEFWDSHNMSTLNPETWNEISRALEGTPGGFVFDMLFGTSPEGNTTQAYMDEQQLAYLAWYMQQNRVFDTDWTPPSESKEYTVSTRTNITDYALHTDNPAQLSSFLQKLNELGINDKILAVKFSSSSAGKWNYPEVRVADKDVVTTKFNVASTSPVTWGSVAPAIPYTKYSFAIEPNGEISQYPIAKDNRSLYYCTNDNTKSSTSEGITVVFSEGPLSGIGQQPDATTPDLSTATSVATVLELLKEQFPQLWTDAVINTVLQPDGALKTFTYVPVPTPDASTALDPQPVTGPATQAKPQVNPETAPSLKDLITSILPKLDPSENKPGIGGGNTPTVVPQTGKASSLYSVYNPTQAQLNQFGAWLWSSDFFEQIKKLFNDPMQAIIGLHKVFSPVQSSGQGSIKCGYLDSSVPSKLVSEQYVTVDCGAVSLQEYFGNVFDYPPFTDISIYLPFIGVRRLDPSDIMRATVSVKYHVDVFTGACLADVNVKRDAAGGVLYTFPGSCSVQYPLSSGSYMGIVSTIASTVVGAVTAPTPLGMGATILGGLTNLAFNSHANVERSGSFTGSAGAMGSKIPYLIISRPQTAMADKFETLSGYPSNTYTPLSACKGFTQVKYCHVESLSATETEKGEIERLLKEGVIL